MITTLGNYELLLGRFISKDPIWPLGGLNPYGYVLNDPINFVDPLGLWPDDPAYIPGPAGSPKNDPNFDRGVNQGVAVGAGAAAVVIGGPVAWPYIATEAGYIYGATKTGATTATAYCALNPQVCASVAGGFLSGITDSKLPPSGNTSWEQFLASQLGKQLGKEVKNACR